jgi:hypothetical protein
MNGWQRELQRKYVWGFIDGAALTWIMVVLVLLISKVIA